jgi:hypothetical protein
LHVGALYAGGRRFETADASASPFFFFHFIFFLFSFFNFSLFTFSFFLSLFFDFIYPSYNVILPDAGCLPIQHPNFWYINQRQFISLNYWYDTMQAPADISKFKSHMDPVYNMRAYEILWRHLLCTKSLQSLPLAFIAIQWMACTEWITFFFTYYREGAALGSLPPHTPLVVPSTTLAEITRMKKSNT